MKNTSELFLKLVQIVRELRDPETGCPWDIEQTHDSLKKFFIEETYEAVQAIEDDLGKLSEELGDVLLQIMLHSQIASEENRFSIDDVIEGISKKLIDRHPHVFGDTKVKNAEEVTKNWEELKKKADKEDSVLDGIPHSLPALLWAYTAGKRVSKVGFDWVTDKGVKAKVKEELLEFLNSENKHTEEEFGDLLFTLAQYARKLDFDPEESLRKANKKFLARFSNMVENSDKPLEELSSAQLEELWNKSKAALS